MNFEKAHHSAKIDKSTKNAVYSRMFSMNLDTPRTLILIPEASNSAQNDVLKTLGNRDINESVALSIGQKLLESYFVPGDHDKSKVFVDFESKLVSDDILIKVCTNLLGKIDTNLLIGHQGHVAGKTFEVIKRLGQHEIEADHFSMDDQGILISGRVKFTLLAYKLKSSNQIVPKSHSFSLILNSYFDKVVSGELKLGDHYGALYSHHETKLRETILNQEDFLVIEEFNKILKLIELSRADSEKSLKQFLKAIG